jgi:hypothetical protein
MAASPGDAETVLADLDLTRGLTLQMTAVGVLALLAVAGPVLLSLLGVEALTVGTPGTVTYLFSFAGTPTEIAFGVGPGVLTLGAALGPGYALVRAHLRGKRPSEPTGDAE